MIITVTTAQLELIIGAIGTAEEIERDDKRSNDLRKMEQALKTSLRRRQYFEQG